MEQIELSSSATSPGFSQIHSTFMYLTIQTDEVEETWKSHVTKVMSESSALLTLNTSHIFPKLYKVCTYGHFYSAVNCIKKSSYSCSVI